MSDLSPSPRTESYSLECHLSGICRGETLKLRLGLEPSLLTKITHLVSGLNEPQAVYVSVQKEFSKRQSDRQEVDLLIQDACERETSGQATGLCPED